MNKLEENYNWLKAVTMLLVVIGHVTRFFYNGMGVVAFDNVPLLNAVTRFIYSFHMPLFIFVSGVIYSYNVQLGKYRKFRSFFVKKFKRLIIPYIFWGGLCVAPIMTAFHFTDQPYSEYLIKGVFASTNARHLWYLWTLFFIFMIINISQRVVKNKKTYTIIMLVVGLLGAVIYNHTTWIFGIGYICRYFIYFVLGINFRNSRIEKIIIRRPLICAVISLAGNLLFTFAISNIVLNILASGFGITFIYAISCFRISKKCKIQNTLYGQNTFGIYLAHPMFIYVFMYYYKDLELYKLVNPIIITPIIIAITLIVSLYIIVLLRKLKLGFVIGEVK